MSTSPISSASAAHVHEFFSGQAEEAPVAAAAGETESATTGDAGGGRPLPGGAPGAPEHGPPAHTPSPGHPNGPPPRAPESSGNGHGPQQQGAGSTTGAPQQQGHSTHSNGAPGGTTGNGVGPQNGNGPTSPNGPPHGTPTLPSGTPGNAGGENGGGVRPLPPNAVGPGGNPVGGGNAGGWGNAGGPGAGQGNGGWLPGGGGWNPGSNGGWGGAGNGNGLGGLIGGLGNAVGAIVGSVPGLVQGAGATVANTLGNAVESFGNGPGGHGGGPPIADGSSPGHGPGNGSGPGSATPQGSSGPASALGDHVDHLVGGSRGESVSATPQTGAPGSRATPSSTAATGSLAAPSTATTPATPTAHPASIAQAATPLADATRGVVVARSAAPAAAEIVPTARASAEPGSAGLSAIGAESAVAPRAGLGATALGAGEIAVMSRYAGAPLSLMTTPPISADGDELGGVTRMALFRADAGNGRETVQDIMGRNYVVYAADGRAVEKNANDRAVRAVGTPNVNAIDEQRASTHGELSTQDLVWKTAVPALGGVAALFGGAAAGTAAIASSGGMAGPFLLTASAMIFGYGALRAGFALRERAANGLEMSPVANAEARRHWIAAGANSIGGIAALAFLIA